MVFFFKKKKKKKAINATIMMGQTPCKLQHLMQKVNVVFRSLFFFFFDK